MATVKFILQKPYQVTPKEDKPQGSGNHKKKSKALNPFETRLYCFLIINRDHKIKIKTEYKILPKEWDFKKQGKKEMLAGSIEFNKDLAELKEKFLDKYKEVIKKTPDMPFKQVASVLKEYGKRIEVPFFDNEKGFFDVLDEYIIFLKGEVAPGTIKKYNTLKKSLKDFISTNKKYENLTFSMINNRFKDDYVIYLRNQKPRGRQKTRPEGLQDGLLNDTIGKYIETLKTFCGWASDPGRDYNKFNYYEKFQITSKANLKRKKQIHDIVTLTLPELKQLYEHDFSNDPYLDRVRDVFCFECFTGQRWGDIEHFDKNQIKDDVWSFTADKTKKDIEIDLTGFASPGLIILKKYNYKLPIISNQKFNLFLKKTVKEAGIKTPVTIRRYIGSDEIKITKPKHEFISSHTARRTCVSILLNDYNMSPVHVMEITAHSDFKTLQKYVKPDRQARREAMSKTTPITEIMKITHKAV